MKTVLHYLIFLVLGVGFTTEAAAQNVTISPESGKLVAAVTYTGEVGFEYGWSALWRHEQLPLTLTVSDQSSLTEGGVLQDPAGNISLDNSQNKFVVMGGKTVTTRMCISLPKGYRFTGYRMVWLNNVNGKTINNAPIVGMNKRLYETDNLFNYSSPKASTENMPSANETKEYVIERTSKNETDMGNNLYFYFGHAQNEFYGATLKSCELYFTAEGTFNAEVKPGTPAEIVANGVNMIGSPFPTSKLDLGDIKPNTKNGVTYYGYNYQNVKELEANNWLYQENAVQAGKLPATASTGNIQALQNDGKLYYALGNGTYYIETPTSTKNQDGVDIPLGYRITGAKIKYHYGTAAPAGTITYDSQLDGYYITAVYNSRTYYLQTNGTWNRYNAVIWKITPGGILYNGNNYLRVSFYNNRYSIYGTTSFNSASRFTIDGNRIKFANNNGYVVMSAYNGRAQITASSTNAASWTQATTGATTTNPAFTPSPFTVKMYNAQGNAVAHEMNVTAGTADGILELTNLNNDAIKFAVEGLAENTKALLTFELTLEALNPFINTIDIICHSMVENGPTLKQQFTSNDFQVSGGKFIFYVPLKFFGGGEQKCRFTFENLYSKYGDETYTDANGNPSGNGNARYFFVKSQYYNETNGNQYSTTGNEPASTKLSTNICGDKPFKYSNIDELNNTNTTGAVTQLREYPYSEELYINGESQGSFTNNIVIAVNNSKPCYLFTADETRWNIAPTTAMEHRYYAYYLMDLQLETKDYVAKCELKKLYNNTCYILDGQDVDKPMYGGVFKAYDAVTNAEIPSDLAYLDVEMMREALQDALYGNADKGIPGVGATGKQVLYLDYTNLYSIHIPQDSEMNEMKSLLNPNCLLYFPERTSYNADNYIQKTRSGDHRACKNIVITDRQPFYAPYKITVPSENYATYIREITIPANGKVTMATVMLPFTLELENGVHTNSTSDGCSFRLRKMAPTGCLNLDSQAQSTAQNFYGKARFDVVTETSSQANVPYMIEVINAPVGDKVSFIATQYGSDVIATPDNMDAVNYTYTGETAEGTLGSVAFTFTNHSSYAGKKFAAQSSNVFYFAKNKFLYCKNLRPEYPDLYIYPFRGYYEYTSSNSGAKLNSFEVVFDMPNDWTTSIIDATQKAELAVYGGTRVITAIAENDTIVKVYGCDGRMVASEALTAGERKDIPVPSGLYVVNGIKLVVK